MKILAKKEFLKRPGYGSISISVSFQLFSNFFFVSRSFLFFSFSSRSNSLLIFFYISRFNPFCYSPSLGESLPFILDKGNPLATLHAILSLLFFQFTILSASLFVADISLFSNFISRAVTYPVILSFFFSFTPSFSPRHLTLNSLSVLVVISSHFIPHFPTPLPFHHHFAPL